MADTTTREPKFRSSNSVIFDGFCELVGVLKSEGFGTRFDHLHFKSSEFEPYTEVDSLSEPWRASLEKELTAYVKLHYKSAACSVFGSSDQGLVTLVCCTESHKFEPSNFW